MSARQPAEERPWAAAAAPVPVLGITRSAAVFGVFQAGAVLAWIAQLWLDPGSDNAWSASIVLIASTVTFQCLRLGQTFKQQPFSSLAVLGLCLTTQWGALVAQSCAWVPMADNLRTPVKTFALLAAYQAMAIGGLWLSARVPPLRGFRGQFGRRVLEPLGIFATPPPANFWCLGAIGFVAILAGAALRGGGGVAGKLIDGCRILTWAPFIIPVLATRIPRYCHLPRQVAGIAAYTLAVFGLGMAVNARTIMFVGVMTIALLALMLLLGSDERLRPAQLWKLAPGVLIAGLGVGYASDLATATVIVRDQRNSAGPLEMIKLTVETLFDTQRIETFKDGLDVYSKVALYDEYYIANQVLTRLIETKFHDNMFFLSSNLQPEELRIVQQHALTSILATVPEPVLNLLGVSVDKANLGYSVGDLFDHLRYGNDLGSFKIGSIFAHGQALFGNWFFGVYLLMCTVVFTVWDSFAQWRPDGTMRYAPVAMLSVFGIFFDTISGDSIIGVVGFLFRGTLQIIVVYAAALAVTRLLFRTPKPTGLPTAGVPHSFEFR